MVFLYSVQVLGGDRASFRRRLLRVEALRQGAGGNRRCADGLDERPASLRQRGALAHERRRRSEVARVLIPGRALTEDGDGPVVEQLLDVSGRLPREISADDAAQVEVDRVHRIIHVHGDRHVVGAEKLHHRQRLVGGPGGIRLLPPFELAVEQIAIDAEIDVRVAVTNARGRKPRLRCPSRFDNGVSNHPGRRGSLSKSLRARAVRVRRRDEEVVRRTPGDRRGSGDRVGHEGRRRTSQIQSDQHRTRAAVVHQDDAGEQRIANRIGGNRQVAWFRRDLHPGGACPQTAGGCLPRLDRLGQAC